MKFQIGAKVSVIITENSFYNFPPGVEMKGVVTFCHRTSTVYTIAQIDNDRDHMICEEDLTLTEDPDTIFKELLRS